jgi:DNA-binding beta-propeller fold protein YncE
MQRTTLVGSAWAAVLVSLCLACGAAGPPPAAPLSSAPEPAVSPPARTELPGVVLGLAGTPEGVAVDRSGEAAVNVRQPDGLVIFDLATPTRRRIIALDGSARHLSLVGPDGPLLIPDESDDRLVELALPSGQVLESIPVGRQPHDAVAASAGAVFVGDELANTIHVIRDGVVTRVIPAPLQPGGLAASPDGSVVVAVGVRGRRISAYRSDGSLIGSANCGAGPTHVVTGAGSLYWVVDTNGGAVLAFRADAHGLRQVASITVGSRPYGVAYDARRSTLWVTLTGTDQLVGLRLRGTVVTSRLIYATVQQPNTVAVAESTGEVVVTGSTPAGAVQLIG